MNGVLNMEYEKLSATRSFQLSTIYFQMIVGWAL